MTRGNNKQSEYEHQVQVFEWAEMMSVQRPELKLLNASLNGVRLTIGQAMKAKRAGMRAGYPDIFLPIRRGIYSGLFIELKKTGGKKPGPEQEKWLEALSEQGFDTYCCKGSMAAISTIESYLNNP
jgi:hypothetical protein